MDGRFHAATTMCVAYAAHEKSEQNLGSGVVFFFSMWDYRSDSLETSRGAHPQGGGQTSFNPTIKWVVYSPVEPSDVAVGVRCSSITDIP